MSRAPQRQRTKKRRNACRRTSVGRADERRMRRTKQTIFRRKLICCKRHCDSSANTDTTCIRYANGRTGTSRKRSCSPPTMRTTAIPSPRASPPPRSACSNMRENFPAAIKSGNTSAIYSPQETPTNCKRPKTPMASTFPSSMFRGLAQTISVSITREVFSVATLMATP